VGGVQQSLSLSHDVVQSARECTTRILLIQAGDDSVVLPAPQEQFCDQATLCTRITIKDGRHGLLNERDELRSEVLTRLVDFLK
jgi:alpha-beta hydrolase superfamily lysophospholipase